MSDVTSNGVFLTLQFTVKETAPVGDTVSVSVVAAPGDFCNISEKDVTFNIIDGSIMIIKGVPGDITGDGLVNSKDLIRLRKFFSGWDVEADMIACDCNGDGNVNSKDLIRLRKYFSGWDVELFYGPINAVDGCAHSLSLVYTAASAPKCEEDGNTAYWHCTKCGKYFRDADGKNEITLASALIGATGHKYSTAWSSDENSHWHSATCEHTSLFADKAEHNWVDTGVVITPATETVEGKKEQKCSICQKTRAVSTGLANHEHTFASDWSMDDTYHWHQATCTHITEVKDYGTHTFVDHICSICDCKELLTVTFVDYNNAIIDEQEVEYSSSAVAPNNPSRSGFAFDGWDKSFNNITENTVVRARYIKQYTVTFVDYDGIVLKQQTVNSGSDATAPLAPAREGYTFIGWDKEYNNVTSSITVSAQYEISVYKVTFVDYEGNEISTQSVAHGYSAKEPEIDLIHLNWADMKGYRFTGWNKSFIHITQSMNIAPLYAEKIEEPIIIVDAETAHNIKKGTTTATVRIYLCGNYSIYGLNMSAQYSDLLSLNDENIKVSNLFTQTAAKLNNSNKTYDLTWSSGTPMLVTEYLEIVSFTFEIPARANAGEYFVNIREGTYFINEQLEKIYPVIISGLVTIVE